MKRFCRYIRYAGMLFRYALALLIGIFARHTPAYRDLWLFAERGYDAQDNAFFLFQFVRQKHPEIHAAYLIGRECPDYGNIIRLGKAIEPGSFSHYLAFACAKVKISTHIMGYSPHMYLFTKLDSHRLVPGRKVFLQHGILFNHIPTLYYPRIRVDLFVCSAGREYQAILDHYGHPQGVVQPLGLCRYDHLFREHTEKRQILILPTWRAALRDCSREAFQASAYFHFFNSLLHHPQMAELLEQYHYTLLVQLHPEMQRFAACFSSVHPRIKIQATNTQNVQQLLLESKLLITDYSSIFFDFAYLGKPLAYYAFDEAYFFATHYQRGYFDLEEDGFGPVCRHPDEVLQFIKERLADNMRVPALYRARAKGFFPPRRTDHCSRTVSAIRALL